METEVLRFVNIIFLPSTMDEINVVRAIRPITYDL